MAKKLFDELEIAGSHSILDFLLDEEASIPKGQLLAIGSLMVVLACTLGAQDASAWHSSHNSFGHISHSNYGPPHVSHASHSSHSSHASHSSSLPKWPNAVR